MFLTEKFKHLVKTKAYLRQTFSLENKTLYATIHEETEPELVFIDSAFKVTTHPFAHTQ